MIVRTICVLLALGAFGSAGARDTWIDEDELVAQTLILAPGEKDRLIRLEEENVLTIRPVALPRGENLHGRNNHFGWPVGAKIGDTLLCAYHRTVRHHGKGPRRDDDSSEAVIVRSMDAGRTWSEPVDIREFGDTQHLQGSTGSAGPCTPTSCEMPWQIDILSKACAHDAEADLWKTYLYRGETRLLLFGPFTRSERIDSRSMRSSRENEQTYTTVR